MVCIQEDYVEGIAIKAMIRVRMLFTMTLARHHESNQPRSLIKPKPRPIHAMPTTCTPSRLTQNNAASSATHFSTP